MFKEFDIPMQKSYVILGTSQTGKYFLGEMSTNLNKSYKNIPYFLIELQIDVLPTFATTGF